MKTPEEGSGKGSMANYVRVDPLFSVEGMHRSPGSCSGLRVLCVFSVRVLKPPLLSGELFIARLSRAIS